VTDQPTTWTLERALAMLRDYKTSRIEGEIGRFIETWGNLWPVLPIAIAALESAAAEIAKERARADAAEKEVERLRAELAAKQPAPTCPCLGALRSWRTSDGESCLRCERCETIYSKAEAAQQGPSDEEIRDQFCRVDRARVLDAEPAALVHLVKLVEMVARRAGVKL